MTRSLDAKVVFHPIDFFVFNGMKSKDLRNLVILDSCKKSSALKLIQDSIFNTIEKGNYEWMTMNVEIDGKFNFK